MGFSLAQAYIELSTKGERQVFSSIDRIRSKLESLKGVNTAFLSGMAGGLGFGLAGGAIGIVTQIGAALAGGVKEMVKLAAGAESAQMEFEVLLKSADKAKSLLGDINALAAKTSLSSSGMTDNARMLLNYGVAAEKIMPLLKQMGDITGGNTVKMASMAKALGQVQQTGHLQGDELEQMISGAGYSPLPTMSKQTGKSPAELRKLMEKGKISSGDVMEAVKVDTSAGGQHFGKMDKMSKTFAGQWDAAYDRIQQGATRIGGKLMEAFNVKGMMGGFGSIIDNVMSGAESIVDQITPNVKAMAGEIGGYFTAIGAQWRAIFGTESGGDIFKTITQSASAFLKVGIDAVTMWARFYRQGAQAITGLIWGIRDFAADWDLTWRIGVTQCELFVANVWNRLKTMKDNFVTVLEWVRNNWQTIFTDIGNIAKTALGNVGKNMKAMGTAFRNYVTGGFLDKDLKVKWVPVLDGLKLSTKAPELKESKWETTNPELERLRGILKEQGETRAAMRAAAGLPADKGPVDENGKPYKGQFSFAGEGTSGDKAKGFEFHGIADYQAAVQKAIGGTDQKLLKATEKQVAATQRQTAATLEMKNTINAMVATMSTLGGIPAVYAE